jgi:hypothetical protein
MQYNDQGRGEKRTNNDIQSTTQKIKKTEQHKRLLKYGDKIRWYDRVSISVPISDTRRCNLIKNLANIFLKTHTHVSNKSHTYVCVPCTSDTTCSSSLAL